METTFDIKGKNSAELTFTLRNRLNSSLHLEHVGLTISETIEVLKDKNFENKPFEKVLLLKNLRR